MLVHDMVFWPLSNPNALAALLSLGLFGALGWLLVAEKKLHSNGALVLCFLLVAALFVSGSKAAFFALVLVLPIFVFLNLAHVKKHWHCMAWLGGGVALLFVVAVLSGAAMPEKLVSMGSELGMKSLHLRFVIWAGAWEMIRDHFWTGTGIGTFFLYYPEYRGKDFISAGLMAHNDPLQFWAEMGVVAPLLFYGFIVLAVTRTVKTLKVLKSDDPQRVMIVTPFCAFAALIVHSHVSFPFYVLSILLSAGFFLALWFWATEKNLEEGGYVIVLPQSWRSQTIWAACFLPFVLLMSVFVAAAGSEILLQRAQMASMKGDMQGFASDVNAASKLSQRMNAKAFILAVSVPMGILESEQSSLSASQKDDLYKQASALLDKAQDLNPRLADSFYQEALLAKLVQKDAEIENLLLEALRVNPLHVAARRKLASYYQMAGRKEEALNVLREGLDWPYRQEAAIGFYQQAAGTFLENGDMVEHKKAMKKMGVYVHQRRQGQE
ncbi:MAG: hypothetical protein DHS20C02_19900 [Micavibrio sp.]|nr:MAG: hypothetical protein DHS20C02_19900 [Micavibrio sp.]